MKISLETINCLQEIITGGMPSVLSSIAPYRSGKDLVDFFNHCAFLLDDNNNAYPNRSEFTKNMLDYFNDTPLMMEIISAALDPRHYFDTEFSSATAAGQLGECLVYDGYKLELVDGLYKVRNIKNGSIPVDLPELINGLPNRKFIEQQIEKCEIKLIKHDYDGAITNARSLVEQVLIDIYEFCKGEKYKTDGKLGKLFTTVRKEINIDPSSTDLSDSIKQLISGLISTVEGVGSLRNEMSDAHAQSYKPALHHAKLAVNSAKTIIDFILGSVEYQISKGKLKPEGK